MDRAPRGRPKGHPKTGGRQKGVTNRATRERQAEVAASGKTPLGHMLEVLNDPSEPAARRDWAAVQAAPYIHPRLQVIDSRIVAKVETSPLGSEERREKARAAIREAFRERPPLVVEGQYHVVGGRAISQDVQQKSVGQSVGGASETDEKPAK